MSLYLADYLIPNFLSIEELEKRYPKRENMNMVTRFAPSPTGFLHTGSLFTALINYKFAKDSGGIFYLRIEDTDSKREVLDAKEKLIESLKEFDITFSNDETYGPYIQSERKLIYDSVLHELIKNDLAYPDFQTVEELDEIRRYQEENKLPIGYYGTFSKGRGLTDDEVISLIEKNMPYVIRFKSNSKVFTYIDLLRGKLNLEPNSLDIVLRKNDGLPTYHFAHVCDDHFMRTTHVIRGEEWIQSVPLHYELFDACGFEVPKYLHLPTIMKQDGDSRRKLSKRLDPEASVESLLQMGYPKEAIIKYLLTLANSNFESWLKENPNTSLDEFKLSIKKFSLSGALFDLDKLNNISKEVIGNYTVSHLVTESFDYAQHYNKELFNYITDYFQQYSLIMSIGKSGPNPRKDDFKYSDILPRIGFFFDEYYKSMPEVENPYPSDLIDSVIDSFIHVDLEDEESWLKEIKEEAYKLGFAKNKKEKEANGLDYMFSDYMNIIRIKLCKSYNSPNLYDVVKILGKDKVLERLYSK